MTIDGVRKYVRFSEYPSSPKDHNHVIVHGEAWTTDGNIVTGSYALHADDLRENRLGRKELICRTEDAILIGMIEQCRAAGVRMCAAVEPSDAD